MPAITVPDRRGNEDALAQEEFHLEDRVFKHAGEFVFKHPDRREDTCSKTKTGHACPHPLFSQQAGEQ